MTGQVTPARRFARRTIETKTPCGLVAHKLIVWRPPWLPRARWALPGLFRSSFLLRSRLPLGRSHRLLRSLGLRAFPPGSHSFGTGGLRNVEAENPGQIFASEQLAGGRSPLRKWSCLAGVGDQLRLVYLAQAEEKLGLAIEPRADAIQHRGDMLAHTGPVGATAGEFDLGGWREQCLFPGGEALSRFPCAP